jgi:hypothetical protein
LTKYGDFGTQETGDKSLELVESNSEESIEEDVARDHSYVSVTEHTSKVFAVTDDACSENKLLKVAPARY